MQEPKRLTLNGLTTSHLIFILLSLVMIGVSIYLTDHFYQVHFPKSLGSENSLCEINSFWGCAKASTSILGSLWYVPTSLFGIIVGAIGVFNSIFPSEENERFTKLVYFLNAAACSVLLIFSLVVLKGLCPFCTVYYLLSYITAYMFYKYSDVRPFPEFKPLIIYFILTLIPSILMHNSYVDEMSRQESLTSQYVNQFNNLEILGDPVIESPYKIHMATENFKDAPLRLTVFSDFECPFCKAVSDQMKPLILAFEDEINIQYMFYPLDNNCNPNIKNVFHRFACKAAYLAACDIKNFHKNHDYIFERQKQLSFENISQWEKDLGLSGCFENKQIQDAIAQTINSAEQFALKSTPTLIINGRKIEGSIPTVHLKAILENILNNGSKNQK